MSFIEKLNVIVLELTTCTTLADFSSKILVGVAERWSRTGKSSLAMTGEYRTCQDPNLIMDSLVYTLAVGFSLSLIGSFNGSDVPTPLPHLPPTHLLSNRLYR